MEKLKSFQSQIYTVNESAFGNIALSIFRYQAVHNPIYRLYLEARNISPNSVNSINEIPFLPIEFFKTHLIKTGSWNEEAIFSSSGSTGLSTSSHPVYDLSFYRNNTRLCFQNFFGPISGYHFLALLPSHLERSNSSLVSMMAHLIHSSGQTSGFDGTCFYLNNLSQLVEDIDMLRSRSVRKIVVFGVPFALLELAETYAADLKGCLVFETGGMKGRRKELTRSELHTALKKGLQVDRIYSEYGMTELFSQAYTQGGSTFACPPWMRILARDLTDPFQVGLTNKPGGLNVIDLANLYTCAFIETSDMGTVLANGEFEVLGRMDNAEIRGCNLMAE
ncbi:hypothetical protein QQ054_25405 [Oscillatoria amoena NRMC-F 0135]|nr:hypothetical protein [Oscillatoria amoena NRMC-F 0135]